LISLVFAVSGNQQHESTLQREHHEILAGIGVGMEKVAFSEQNPQYVRIPANSLYSESY